MKKKTNKPGSGTQGFRLRSILIHSLWITAVGIVLFRLATANTQKQVLYVHTFAISGAVLATAPWVLQLLTSTAIIVLYNAGVFDFTWLVRSESKEGSRAIDRDIERGEPRIGHADERGLVSRNGWTIINKGFGFKIEGSNSPKLQRNRTI